MKSSLVITMMMAAGLAAGDCLRGPQRYPGRLPRKCMLPGCDNLTDHAGGFCSADHSKQHRAARQAAQVRR